MALEHPPPSLTALEEAVAGIARLRREWDAQPSTHSRASQLLEQAERQSAELLEQIEDGLATLAYLRTRGQETVPANVVDRLIARENPIRVWREHRELTPSEVSGRTAIPEARLRALEDGSQVASLPELRRLADCLGVDIDDLVRSEAA